MNSLACSFISADKDKDEGEMGRTFIWLLKIIYLFKKIAVWKLYF